MRTATDALRSFKRYISLALPDYKVVVEGEEGTAKRPFVVVKQTTPDALTGPFHSLDVVASLAAYVYPPVLDRVMEGSFAAGDVKERLTQALAMGVVAGEQADGGIGRSGEIPLYDYEDKAWDEGARGRQTTRLDGDSTLPGTVLVDNASTFPAAPAVVLINGAWHLYTAKTNSSLTIPEGEDELTDGTLVQQFGDRWPQDYARIQDLNISVNQNPDDEKRFTVLAEVRIGYRRGRVLPSIAEMTDSVRVSFH